MGAKRGFCIFMASRVTMRVPWATESPSWHWTFFTTPGIGALRMWAWSSCPFKTQGYSLQLIVSALQFEVPQRTFILQQPVTYI